MLGDNSSLQRVSGPRPNAQMPDSEPLISLEPVGLRTGGVKRARQRGNAILEGALIFLPMMAFFFGIVDVSLAIFIQSTLTTATREGTRFAITYGSTFNGNSCASSQSSCVDQVVQYNAVGLPSGLSDSYITVNYYTANDLANPVMACNAGTGSMWRTILRPSKGFWRPGRWGRLTPLAANRR